MCVCMCLVQALDEQYLGVDAQFGGEDQRKIFTLAEKVSRIFVYKSNTCMCKDNTCTCIKTM